VELKKPGQVALFRFPFADRPQEKLRPALLISRLPGKHDDWLVCMISSNLNKFVEGYDEIISKSSPDFKRSGLKRDSIIRITRLAILPGESLAGKIGNISKDRLIRIKKNLVSWIGAS
jgi:mRNA interferase MazF